MILDSLSGLDRVQLLEVYARSVMLLELGRCAEWVELFLPDARVSCAGRAEGGAEFRGREALLGLGRRMASGEFDVVTVTTLGGPNPPRWPASGRYADRLSKGAEDCWRLQGRTFIADK
jgi:hypothetical protein